MNAETTVWEGDSPWVALIKLEYEAAGLDRWDNHRVNGTCQLLGCDIYSLCAVCGMTNRFKVQQWLKKNRWPTEMALHFFLLERVKCRVPGSSVMHRAMTMALNMEATA